MKNGGKDLLKNAKVPYSRFFVPRFLDPAIQGAIKGAKGLMKGGVKGLLKGGAKGLMKGGAKGLLKTAGKGILKKALIANPVGLKGHIFPFTILE